MDAQTWASYSALYRSGRLSVLALPFGTSADMSGHFGTNAEMSLVQSVLTPFIYAKVNMYKMQKWDNAKVTVKINGRDTSVGFFSVFYRVFSSVLIYRYKMIK